MEANGALGGRGMLPLRRGDAPTRADALDGDLAIADPAERLAKGLHEAGTDAALALERHHDWQLEMELRLCRLAAKRAGGAGAQPAAGAHELPARTSDLHRRETALSQSGRSAALAALAHGAAGAEQLLAEAREARERHADVERAALSADGAHGFGAAQVRQQPRREEGAPPRKWSDALYSERRPGQVWHRPDVAERFGANYDAQAAKAQAARRHRAASREDGS